MLPTDALCFGALGFGVTWTLSDFMFASVPTFMRCLPEGLLLPDRMSVGNLTAQVAGLVVWRVSTAVFGNPSFKGYAAVVWASLAIHIGGAVIVALGWTVVVDSHAVVVIGVESFAALVGTTSWAATIPFISTHFAEDKMVSAFFTGSTCGSLVAGLLSFSRWSPLVSLLILALLLVPSVLAWCWILKHAKRRHIGTSSASTLPLEIPMEVLPPTPSSDPKGIDEIVVDEDTIDVAAVAAARAGAASPVASPHQRPSLHHQWVAPWLQESLGPWAIAVPINMATWGFAPNVSNLAAAHAGCSCDPADEVVNTTYNIVLSFGFTAMPLAALLSYLRPCHSIQFLRLLAVILIACFALLLSGASGAAFMSCSTGASVTLALAVFAMRAIDTYVTAMLYRLVAVRCRARSSVAPAEAEKATLALGQLLVATTLTAVLLAVTLVDRGVLACRIGGGHDNGSPLGANATGPSPLTGAEHGSDSDCHAFI